MQQRDKRAQDKDIKRAIAMEISAVTVKTTRFDADDRLKTRDNIAGYLDAILEDGDHESLKLGVRRYRPHPDREGSRPGDRRQ
jgi:hypothetical protein